QGSSPTSTRRFLPPGRAAWSASPTGVGGSTCGGAPPAGTSAAVTPLPRSTRRRTTARPGIPSSAASSPARTGATTTGPRTSSRVRSWPRRRVAPSSRGPRRHAIASLRTGDSSSTDGPDPHYTATVVRRLPRSPMWLPWVLLGIATLGLLLPWLLAPVAWDERYRWPAAPGRMEDTVLGAITWTVNVMQWRVQAGRIAPIGVLVQHIIYLLGMKVAFSTGIPLA